MDRTTIYLPPSLKRRLRAAAARQKTTEAAVLRDALERHLTPGRRAKVRPVGRSTDGGIAHRLDEALEESGFGR